MTQAGGELNWVLIWTVILSSSVVASAVSSVISVIRDRLSRRHERDVQVAEWRRAEWVAAANRRREVAKAFLKAISRLVVLHSNRSGDAQGTMDRANVLLQLSDHLDEIEFEFGRDSGTWRFAGEILHLAQETSPLSQELGVKLAAFSSTARSEVSELTELK